MHELTEIWLTASIVRLLEKAGPKVTWDQALFSFGFENYILEGKAKWKESPNFSGSH